MQCAAVTTTVLTAVSHFLPWVPLCAIHLSQNLYIFDLRSGPIRDLYVTSLRENIEMRPALSKRVKKHQILLELCQIILSVMIHVSLTEWGTGKGHLRSYEVINSLLPKSHGVMMLKTCKSYQTARLVKTRRLICNMPITPAHYWVMT